MITIPEHLKPGATTPEQIVMPEHIRVTREVVKVTPKQGTFSSAAGIASLPRGPRY